MRRVPAAVAQVVADTVLGNAAKGVIQGFDPQLRPPAVGLRALGHEVVVSVGEHRVVDLHKQAGFVDCQVFVAKRLGQRVDVLLVTLVEVVYSIERGAGRGYDRKERFLDLNASCGGLQVFDVTRNAVLVDVDDGLNTHIGASPAHSPTSTSGGFEELAEALGILPRVVDRHVALGIMLEARDSLVDVRAPARFGELTIVDHVYAGFSLTVDDISNCRSKRFVVCLLVDRVALLACLVELHDLRWPDQASRVCRKNAILALLHVLSRTRLLSQSCDLSNARALSGKSPQPVEAGVTLLESRSALRPRRTTWLPGASPCLTAQSRSPGSVHPGACGWLPSRYCNSSCSAGPRKAALL